MPITALPPAPTRADPVNFSARGDALMTALPTFVTEANALAVEVNNNASTAAGATAAANTATTAATTATNASNIASAAATDVDAKYLGPKASPPTLNNQGGALGIGVMYFNSVSTTMFIWTGSAWQASAGSISGNFTVIRQKIVATASQTLFTLSNPYSLGQGVLAVYKNGSRLLLTDNYTETSGTSVTMVTPASVNDVYYFEIGPTALGTSFAASNVTFTPAGNIAASNVQAALQELDTEKIGSTITTAFNEARGADIASAGPINLTNATGNLVDVTGTTTITAITLADGAERTVRFTGSLTLTHGASLILPGSANIQTAAGDYAVFRGYAAGEVRCISFNPGIGVGYRNVPQNIQSAAYTLTIADAGKHILHPTADPTARTFTIPANASVAFPIGTAITFVNQSSAGIVTIAITTDTMRLAPGGTTESRSLAANGIATALKITETEWIISGSGIT